MEVVRALEVLVDLDRPAHLFGDVRPQDLRRDAWVVRDAHRLADVGGEPRDDVVVGTGVLGERRGLEAVGQLVDRELLVTSARLRSIASRKIVGDSELVSAIVSAWRSPPTPSAVESAPSA